jgi:hypothetical protein
VLSLTTWNNFLERLYSLFHLVSDMPTRLRSLEDCTTCVSLGPSAPVPLMYFQPANGIRTFEVDPQVYESWDAPWRKEVYPSSYDDTSRGRQHSLTWGSPDLSFVGSFHLIFCPEPPESPTLPGVEHEPDGPPSRQSHRLLLKELSPSPLTQLV